VNLDEGGIWAIECEGEGVRGPGFAAEDPTAVIVHDAVAIGEDGDRTVEVVRRRRGRGQGHMGQGAHPQELTSLSVLRGELDVIPRRRRRR
jgi:hypothetical protein